MNTFYKDAHILCKINYWMCTYALWFSQKTDVSSNYFTATLPGGRVSNKETNLYAPDKDRKLLNGQQQNIIVIAIAKNCFLKDNILTGD